MLRVVRHFIIFSSSTLLSRFTGIVRDLLLLVSLGISIHTDILLFVFKIANFLRVVISEGAFSSIFIPFISNVQKSSKNKEEYNAFISQFTYLYILFLFSLISVTACFLPQIINLMSPGFKDRGIFEIALHVSYVVIPYIFLSNLSFYFCNFFQQKLSFSLYGLLPIIFNFAIITTSCISWFFYEGKLDVIFYTYGILISGILQLALVFWKLKTKLGFAFVRIGHWQWSYLRLFLHNYVYSFFSYLFVQSTIIVDLIVTSFHEGALSILYYSERIVMLPVSLIGTSLAVIFLPNITNLYNKSMFKKMHYLQNYVILISIIFAGTISISLFFSIESILQILFYNIFSSQELLDISYMIKIYSLAMLPSIMFKILVNMFYIRLENKGICYINVFCSIMYLLLNFIIYSQISFFSIAVSTVIVSYLRIMLLLPYLYIKKYLFFFDRLKILFMYLSLYLLSVYLLSSYLIVLTDIHILRILIQFCIVVVLLLSLYIITRKTIRINFVNLLRYKKKN